MDRSTKQKYGPKAASHPSIGEPCPACKVAFKKGDYTTLIVLGPGKDEDSRERARRGEAYSAVAIEVHWACATGAD